MRITNGMINNSMMLNIQRNAMLTNKYYNQIASGKKIQIPSDDPIIASRALRFRTNVSETEQYRKNVAQAQSWTEITAQAFSNVTEISKSIEEALVRGSTDTLTTEDRKKIIADISSMAEQLQLEMNGTYAGRYVFSGYRTDQAPTYFKDSTDAYRITQTFSLEDVQNTKYFHKPEADESSTIGDCKILALPYENVENLTIGGYTVVEKNSTDAVNPYDVPAGAIHYIKDTGELVIGEDVYDDIKTNDLSVTYEKKGFTKGDMNPIVHFECEDINPDSKNFGMTFDMNGQNDMSYEIGVGNILNINSLSKDVVSDKVVGELNRFISTINSLEVSNESDVREKLIADGLTGDELENAVDAQLQQENAQVKVVSQELFSNLLGKMENYTSKVSINETNLGSRMNRLELVSNRLAEDALSYETLMSENEDVDVAEVIMQLNNAEAVYQASLNVGAKLTQLTLVDYIN